MAFEEIVAERPENWPANCREAKLEAICDAVENFRKNPTIETREILLALVSEHDLNQQSSLGLIRITEYEVALINHLYIAGQHHNIPSLRVYLYDVVGWTTRLNKITSQIAEALNENTVDNWGIDAYCKGLFPSLKLYHLAYQKYTFEKNAPFAAQLISLVNEILDSNLSGESINILTVAYCSLLNDISYMHGEKREGIWKFTRDELLELFTLEAKLVKLNHESPVQRPLKGVLMTQISNFVLKSRNQYNQDYICKYLPEEVAYESGINHQIWMRQIAKLNDEREQKVIPELFNDLSWVKYTWVKQPDFRPTRCYYVSSFCKSQDSANMKENYGACIYGYKNDRIADLIGPIGFYRLKRNANLSGDLPDEIESPFISQVIAFDVLYDANEAKEELRFLFQVIDEFDMEDDQKQKFLDDILQYWILSVKDPKWKDERERRYVVFLYDCYRYSEMERDETFLKVKTSLFLTPDFIRGDNPSKEEIRRQLYAKRKALFTGMFLLCEDCLNQDYDVITCGETVHSCPICGSRNVVVIQDRVQMIEKMREHGWDFYK